MKYNVEVEETLSRVVEIEAESEIDAILMAKAMYLDEEIVLNADDWACTDYQIVK